jgi:kinesin family protein 15
MKFEIDQLSKSLQNCKQENETLKSDLNVSERDLDNW